MALQRGTRLGAYEIQSAIGAGGMGEVYKARDTRLDRLVAIKVLPPEFADDSQFRERFDREARTISQLDHPHICSLYDIGETESSTGSTKSTAYLVMQYLEGDTLEQRLKRGAVPQDEALKTAIQVADALDKAHRAGVTHRDLKPGNIMITKAGAKLLDFGLAKTGGTPVAGASLSIAPTTPANLTVEGAIVGTFQYMAPEQLEGGEADARTDLFAFGVVLYEMLTGRKAFEGKTQASLIGAILKDQPPTIGASQGLAVSALDRVIRKCLAKDPDARWQSATDLRDELQWIAETRGEAGAAPSATHDRRASASLPWIVTGIVIAGALAVSIVAMRFRSVPVDQFETRLEVVTPPTTDPISLAISPDGRRLVYVGAGGDTSRLWLRTLDSLAAQPLAGTDNALYPFWSPDGRSIAFFAGNQLMRVDIGAGLPQAIAKAVAPRGGAWSRDGGILFPPGSTSGLFRVSATGGEPVAVTTLKPGQTSHRYPAFLPDGRHFVFLSQGSVESQGIYVGSLDGQDPIRLTAAETAAVGFPGDEILYVRQGALIARHLDTTRWTLDGDPVVVADSVGFDQGFNVGAFSASATGVIVYRPGAVARRQLVWFDRSGRQLGALGEPDEAAVLYPELSRDDRRLVLSRTLQGNADVWIVDLSRGVPTRFTFDPGTDTSPLWSPDGSRIVFRSSRKGPYDLYQKPSSGAGDETPVLMSQQSKFPNDWSPDGRFVLFQDLDPKSGNDLFYLPLDGDKKPTLLVQTAFDESQGQFSPDGRWVAYQTNESGRFEIVVVPFPRPTAKFQISSGGGSQPRWRRDGKELFYVAPDGKLMGVAIRAADSTLEAESPVPLFQTRTPSGTAFVKQQYAVTRDGRFLVNNATEASVASPITIVQNWKPARRTP